MACYNPYKLKDPHPHTGEDQFVPCGKCPECTKRAISGWSFRLMKEEQNADSAHFVTLTYDNDHVPLSRSGFMTLVKKDVQNFLKRLRFIQGATAGEQQRIKYFAVGEYGSQGMRPHYHLILFNAEPTYVVQAWALDDKPLGNVFFGHDCREAAVGYCLKYMHKPKQVPKHRNDDRVPEFRLMSKALGSDISPSKCLNGTEPI